MVRIRGERTQLCMTIGELCTTTGELCMTTGELCMTTGATLPVANAALLKTKCDFANGKYDLA